MKVKSKFVLSLIAVLGLTGSIETASAALIVNPAQLITHTVTVQPILVSDTDGSNLAEFFGTAGQQSAIEGFIDTIWAQAGIDVNFLSANFWSNTFANEGSANPRPTSDLSTIVSDGSAAGVTHSDSNVINLFFVNIPAGFPSLSENTAAGLAFLGGNGISQYVGSNLLGFTGGQEVIASVVAHEIGHNLGLPHLTEAFNLMQVGGSPDSGEQLNATQISIALNSNLSVATVVPVPPALILMLSGVGVFGLFGRKKRTVH